MGSKYTYADAADWVGREIAVSPWLTVDQAQIDRFAEATHDRDWMHVDPARAAAQSPFGGTIAFGFQTLSLLTHFSHLAGFWPKGTAYGVNYGLDRVRFLMPVRAGARIRARFVLAGFEPRSDGGYRIASEATVEIEGENKPAMVARWLGLFYPETAGP